MSAPEDADERSSSSPRSQARQDADADGAAGSNADGIGTTPPAVPVTLLEDACERLRIERRILTDERCAFEQFAGRLVATDGPVSPATIESHYRETVMAVPHYHDEYGDTYAESVAAEFGRRIAADLQRLRRVGPATVDAIRRAARRCRSSRDRVVDRIDAERHAVRAARDEIDAMWEALASIGGGDPGDGTTGPTLRSRCRLRLLLVRCDDLARRRREQLGVDAVGPAGEEGTTATAVTDAMERPSTDSSGAKGPGGPEGPAADAATNCVAGEPTGDGLEPGQLQSLCYGELDTERPVLAVLAALRRAIAARRCRGRHSRSE